MEKVLTSKSSITAVADAIRSKGGTEESLVFPNGFVEAIQSLNSADEADNSFEHVTGLNMAFMAAVFPENYNLVLSVPNFKGNLSNAFSQSQNLKTIKLVCDDTSGTFNSDGSFYGCSTTEMIDLIEFKKKPYSGSNTFTNCYALQEIKGELDYSECVSSNITAFLNAWSLREVHFKPKSIKISLNIASTSVLSSTAIQSIIDGLADLTSGSAQTLTLHADVKARLTDEQIAAITSKNWTLA